MTAQPLLLQDEVSASAPELRLVFASTPMAVRAALAATLDGLAELALPDEDRGALEIVLAEILNNVVEHAYAESSEGRIELTVWPSAAGIVCEVVDEGRPMPEGKLPEPTLRALPTDDVALPEGGFGWSLIRLLCAELRCVRESGRNRLSLRLERSDAPR